MQQENACLKLTIIKSLQCPKKNVPFLLTLSISTERFHNLMVDFEQVLIK